MRPIGEDLDPLIARLRGSILTQGPWLREKSEWGCMGQYRGDVEHGREASTSTPTLTTIQAGGGCDLSWERGRGEAETLNHISHIPIKGGLLYPGPCCRVKLHPCIPHCPEQGPSLPRQSMEGEHLLQEVDGAPSEDLTPLAGVSPPSKEEVGKEHGDRVLGGWSD